MKRTRKAIGWRYRRGSIAVEAAIVLPILLLIVLFPSVKLAFYFRQYSAAQKAIHDAALYLSTAPRVELTTSGPDGNIAALTVATRIVEREMAGIVPSDVSVDPAVYCIYQVGGNEMSKPCTTTYTKNVNHTLVQFRVTAGFPYMDPLTGSDTGSLISPYVPVRYVAN